jgi:hypothetical protein
MKKVVLISILFCAVALSSVTAQVRWPFGAANAITSTSADTIVYDNEFTRGLNYITIATDTNIVVQATNLSSELKLGDMVIFELTESTANADTVTWSTGFTGVATPIPSGKTKFVEFIYNGSALKKKNEQQAN